MAWEGWERWNPGHMGLFEVPNCHLVPLGQSSCLPGVCCGDLVAINTWVNSNSVTQFASRIGFLIFPGISNLPFPGILDSFPGNPGISREVVIYCLLFIIYDKGVQNTLVNYLLIIPHSNIVTKSLIR